MEHTTSQSGVGGVGIKVGEIRVGKVGWVEWGRGEVKIGEGR